jgi:type VI secretion system protein ImpF
MATRNQPDTNVTLSVLDRLLDADPRTSTEAYPTRAQSVRQLKNAVRRDLEWLLNTRRIAVEPDESLKEVNRSVYMFGLPDFTAFSVANSKDQVRLLRILQGALKTFEPRLANPRIVPLESNEVGSRRLRFRIEGLLLMDPAPELISFDTVLELTSGEYEVKGDADAG